MGTDAYGFAWRDDGTLFHTARPIENVIRRNLSLSSLSTPSTLTSSTQTSISTKPRTTEGGSKSAASGPSSSSSSSTPAQVPYGTPNIVSHPSVELLGDVSSADVDIDVKESESSGDPDSVCHLEPFTTGDILGFGIELPESNFKFITALHAHQEMELARQDDLLTLRRTVHYNQTALSYPGADVTLLKSQIAEAQDKIASMKSVPAFEAPIMLKDTRLTFYKNGVLQKAAIIDLPPGSYYPAFSMYYQGAVVVNYGPNFAHPPPPGFQPAAQLPQAYRIPLPHVRFLPPLPTGTP